jgi:hypothetical protein
MPHSNGASVAQAAVSARQVGRVIRLVKEGSIKDKAYI